MSLELLSAGDARLAPSSRIGDAWAAISAVGALHGRSERERMRSLLVERPRPLDRTERPGHLTGSALVVDPSGTRTLVLHHAKLGIWVQPGGHADGDANLAGVALREAIEETGIDGLRIHPTAVDLDIHRVAPPTEDPHLHFDVRFVAVAPADVVVTINEESHDHRWVTPEELPALGADPGLRRLTRVGLELVRTEASD